jgi:hypothetical protein
VLNKLWTESGLADKDMVMDVVTVLHFNEA